MKFTFSDVGINVFDFFYALVLVVGIYFKSFELNGTEKVNLNVLHTKYNFVRIYYYKSYVLAVFS